MERRQFLGSVLFSACGGLIGVGSLALPAALGHHAPAKPISLILAYRNRSDEAIKPDFQWVDGSSYERLVQAYQQEGKLLSARIYEHADRTEVHYTFPSVKDLNLFYGELAVISSRSARVSSGFEVEVKIV